MSQPVDNSRVVVSTPQYGCVSQIRRAVDGVLGQTHRNLQLVVVNCGDPESPWDELADMEDPRLVRFELFENRGPYFAHQVVLQATEADYFVVQDADDWSEPPRVAMLLRALRQRHAVAAVSLDRQHHVNGRVADSQPLNPRQAPGPDLTHWANHHALFRVDALRAIGGYDAGFQLGYDTLLMSLLAMIGPIAQVDCVLYHRHHRPDSLTHHPTTGFGSERRNQAIAELRQLHDRVYAEYERYLAGGIGRERLMESMVAAVGEASDRERKDAIAAHALRLRAALAQANGRANGQADGRVDGQLGQHSSFRMCPVRVGVQGSLQAPAAASVCTERLRTSWSMEPEALDALLQRIAELRPRRMLELGSGVSTLCLAKYARDHQITFQSLEHDEDYLRRTRDVLRSERLDPYVELTHAPVQRVRCAGLELQGYDFQRVEGEFGFVLMDGPPCSIGREANYFLLRPHLAASHELWLHDGYRLHELNCLELWQTHHRFSAQLRPYGDSGMWVIRSSVDTAPRQAAMPVGVSLLTGGRPELLSRTIAALQARAPWLLAEHFVQVVING
ncbi:MAG: glycosyltransferase, partial [Planctomycetales bacterium]|nr:glycosyltransferase [Planctomycetales bacterium]